MESLDQEFATKPAANGQRTEPVRVRFGPGKSQTMPLEWAELILTALAEDKPKFGKFLTDAALAAK